MYVLNLRRPVKYIIRSVCIKLCGLRPDEPPGIWQEKKSFRLNMLFEPNELEELDNFRYSARVPSRSEAIRMLMKLGMDAFAAKADKEKSPTDASNKSS